MAPTRFEDKLREQLETRQLQPGEEAWNKLNDQLDIHEASSNKKKYWWIGIAASFIGVLLLVTFLNKDVQETVPEPIIVDTENMVSPVEDQEGKATEIVEQKIIEEVNTKVTPKQKIKQQTSEPVLKQQLQEEQQKLVPTKTEEAVAEVSADKTTEETSKNTLRFEEQKAKEVVAQIKALQQQKETITDAEIDTLLKAAQKEIELEKLYNEATNKVDANALLQSVEDDLERSFRKRVFEMLSSGYQELKTAVAERNN